MLATLQQSNPSAASPSRLLLSQDDMMRRRLRRRGCSWTVHGGVKEKSSNRRLPGQELASGRGLRVGMRAVAKVF